MIKIGIIGTGFGQYGLFPAFHSVKQCKIVAIAGKKRPQLVAYCRKIGFTNIYADWRKLLGTEKLQAVALAVTPQAQYEIAQVAIAKGLHVFAEKPFTVNEAQARTLVKLAKAAHITHTIDFTFPEIAEWKKAKKLLEKERYGKLLHIAVNWDFLSYDIKHKALSWKTNIAEGGGVTSFFFSHGLYYLEQFAGPITSIQSVLTKSAHSVNGGEAGVDLVFTYKSGVTGHAHVNANSRGLTRHQLVFYCEGAVLKLENSHKVVDNFMLSVYQGGRVKMIRVAKDHGDKHEDERVKIVRKLAKRFISCCISKKQMTPSFADGLRVQELLEMIHRQNS